MSRKKQLAPANLIQSQVVHRSVNACLCPLYAIEGMHVVTVEGGSWGAGLENVDNAEGIETSRGLRIDRDACNCRECSVGGTELTLKSTSQLCRAPAS